jgi:hypothetical protein
MTVNYRPWTPDEVELLTRTPPLSVKEIGARLGRSARSVTMTRYRLRKAKSFVSPRNTTWSPSENEYLRMNYGAVSLNALARKLKRTATAVRVQATKIGLAREPHQRMQGHDDGGMGDHAWASPSPRFTPCRGVVSLTFGKRRRRWQGRAFVIDEATIIEWLRAGNAVRCAEQLNTVSHPLYHRRRQGAVHHRRCARRHQNPWLAVYNLGCHARHDANAQASWYSDRQRQGRCPLGVVCQSGRLCPHLQSGQRRATRTSKTPTSEALWLAWESVYVTRRELERYYEVKPAHPKPISYGVYVRADVVAWLKTRPRISRHAAALRQDVVTWQELHADIDRKVRLGQPL